MKIGGTKRKQDDRLVLRMLSMTQNHLKVFVTLHIYLWRKPNNLQSSVYAEVSDT